MANRGQPGSPPFESQSRLKSPRREAIDTGPSQKIFSRNTAVASQAGLGGRRKDCQLHAVQQSSGY